MAAEMARRAPRGRQLTLAQDRELEFVQAPDVARVAESIVAEHEVVFAHLRNFQLLYLLRRGAGERPGEIDAIAKAFKVPAIWRAVTGFDAGIWIREPYWERFSPEQQAAVTMHELLHIGMTGRGQVRLEKHDLEEFGMVVRIYGPWLEHIDLFAHQLALFQPAGADGNGHRPDVQPR